MTKRNTMLTTFAQQTDAQFYLNNQRSQNASQLDGAVLAPFAKVLDDPAPKKFIVVHLLGTHMNYKYRYPADYARFVDRQGPGAPQRRPGGGLQQLRQRRAAQRLVVSSLIKGFANSDPNGFLVCLSDHGEEVFDEARTTVSAATKATRPAACTVPFLVDFAQLAADPPTRPAGPGRPTLQQRRPDPYLVRPRRPQLRPSIRPRAW